MSTIYALSVSVPGNPPVIALFRAIPNAHAAMLGLKRALGKNEPAAVEFTAVLVPYLQALDPIELSKHFSECAKIGMHPGMSVEIPNGVLAISAIEMD